MFVGDLIFHEVFLKLFYLSIEALEHHNPTLALIILAINIHSDRNASQRYKLFSSGMFQNKL